MKRLNPTQFDWLLDLAESTLHEVLGLPGRTLPPPDGGLITAPGASFVTLMHDERLRGCIGTLEAVRPLHEDVRANTRAAALDDPRFPPLRREELAGLELSLSVLSPPAPLDFIDERDLVEQLQPGIDGVILEADSHRGTFLPSVWSTLPDPVEFLIQLRRKAGLPGDLPLERTTLWRYTTESASRRLTPA